VLDYVFEGAMPKQVYSKGYRFDSRQFPDYVISDLDYGDFTVQLQMGWYYPKKTRTITTITNQGHHTWDDVENTWTFEANYMSGKYQEQNPSQNYKVAPNRTFTPVENEIQHFINCIENNIEPITGSDHALRVTHIVNHLEQSLKIQEPCTIIY
jgi:predicted dehydrogenase